MLERLHTSDYWAARGQRSTIIGYPPSAAFVPMVNISMKSYFFTAGRRPKFFRNQASKSNSDDVIDDGSRTEPEKKYLGASDCVFLPRK